MTDSQQHPEKPRPKQLHYLRELAMQCGESFTMPPTVAEASAEIDRLKARKRSSRADRRRELAQVRQAMAERGGDATAVLDSEIVGYGSNATWR